MKFITFTLTYLLLSIFVSNAQEVVHYKNKNIVQLVGHQTYFFKDSTNLLTIEDVLKNENQVKFILNNQKSPNLGTTKSTIWCRITITNETESELLFDLGSSIIQNVDFYHPKADGSYEITKTGTLKDFDSREFNTNNFLFRLLKASDTTQKTFYLKIQSAHPIELPMAIGSIEEFLHYYHKIDLFYGFYFGLMLVMVFYNFFVYLSVRDKGYLYYIGYLLGAMLINAFLLGNYAFEILWQGFELINQYFIFWASFTPIIAIIFTMRFLHTDEYVPLMHKILKAFLFIIPIFQVLNLFGFYAEIVEPFQAVISIPTILMLIASILVYRKGFKTALFFFLGWLIYIIGIIIFVLTIQDILPGSFIFKNAVIIGQEIEVVLFAFALGAKINDLRKEKEQAQGEALLKAQENEKLVLEQNIALEEKVKERTLELESNNVLLADKNEEVIAQQNDLLAINEELNQQNAAIEEINRTIEHTYKQLRSSIEYAKNIQSAILPFDARIKKSINDFFVLYKPKDIVSGDFYWLQDMAVKMLSQKTGAIVLTDEEAMKSSKVIIVVADSTGHGVPGAFMSMIGNELLSQIININGIVSPEEILFHLHIGIRYALNQDETTSRDGMDIAICVYDKAEKTIEYAGAMNPLYYVENEEFKEIKATKMPIGGYQKEDSRNFEKHTIKITSPTMFYMCTDGYQDQFGGIKDTKFMSKNVRKLLSSIYDLPMDEQRDKLEEIIEAWKGDMKQTDDITIFGFKIYP